MKILLISEFFPTGKDLRFSGGVETRTFFIAKYLAKKHEVSVICSSEPNTKKQEKIYGINVHRVGPIKDYRASANPQSFISLLKFCTEAVKFGSKLETDIVDGGNFLCHLIAKQIALRKDIPVVFWYPDVFIGQWNKTSGFISGLSGWLLERFNLIRSADFFIAISNSTLGKLKKINISKNRMTLIPCGVDLDEFKGKSKKFEIPTIVNISRLVHYKRVEDLIWAFALLSKKKELRLIIVGRGPEEEKLKNIIKMLKLKNKISFTSNLPRSKLVKLLKSSHLLCLPSEVEGFGISIVEAAAAGVPYVASNISVFKEITKNGKGGLLFKLADIKDLAKNIEKVLDDKKLYQQKVIEGQKLVKNYQWSTIARDTELLYKSLIK